MPDSEVSAGPDRSASLPQTVLEPFARQSYHVLSGRSTTIIFLHSTLSKTTVPEATRSNNVNLQQSVTTAQAARKQLQDS